MKHLRFSVPALLPFALLCACTSGTDGYVAGYEGGDLPPTQTESIDIGGGLESPPGEGVNLNIDVAAGGIWRIATTCDTEKEGFICSWDLVASIDPDAGPLEVADESTLENRDETIRVDASAIRIYMENGTDADYVELGAPEGAALTLDVILDGNHSYPPVLEAISWVSAGEVRTGARSNPTEFEPVEP